MSKKINLKLLFLLVAVLGIATAVHLVQQRQEIRKEAAEVPSTRIYFSPSQLNVAPNQEFELRILVDTGDNKLSTLIIYLNYDSSKLEALGFNFNSSLLPQVLVGPNLSTPNRIRASAGVTPETYIQGAGQEIATVSFKSLATLAATQVDFSQQTEALTAQHQVDPNNPDFVLINLISQADNALINITDQPTPGVSFPITPTAWPTAEVGTPTPSASPTPSEPPSPTITPTPIVPLGVVRTQLSLRFPGIFGQGPDLPVSIKIGKGTVNYQQHLTNVSSDSNGLYQSQVWPLVETIVAGDNYYFLVKGPKHLQTRYCLNQGQSRPCTIGRILLQEGTNLLDFSGYPMPAGDLPHPAYGQDGVVNSLDAVLLVSCFAAPTDPECLDWADINYDGIVSIIDMELMNQTIYSRWEDEDI